MRLVSAVSGGVCPLTFNMGKDWVTPPGISAARPAPLLPYLPQLKFADP